MIYTIGHQENYERAFQRHGEGKVVKAGRYTKPDGTVYPGGCVWKTREEAQNYLTKFPNLSWKIYGVLADWETDTAPNEAGQPWHDLLRDARVVRLTHTEQDRPNRSPFLVAAHQ